MNIDHFDPRPGRMATREMTNTNDDRLMLIGRLRELIDALDARVPHLEREGEIQIAGDAAALKSKALERIARLEAMSVKSDRLT